MDMKDKLTTWEDIEKEVYTPEEVAISDLHAELMCELIRARNERRISQRELEELCGVRQPVIARMEKGENTKIDTIIKVLIPLGKKLAIVPLTEAAN
ncbi:MAG: XRE family transcriptional regulator [Spirochaetales bacterium]|nr:XRE family transcriptional regulator [Spirochaetales bacterium]